VPDALLSEATSAAGRLGRTRWREFARRATLLGHDLDALQSGAELVTHTTTESIALIRGHCLADAAARRRRQAVFFSPEIELRRPYGQGIHDRLEACVFADGEMDAADMRQASIHFPFPTRTLSVLSKTVLDGETWDLSVRGDYWDLDERDDIVNVVNVGELSVETGASVIVRGNLLVLSIQRLVCEPRHDAVPHHFAILPTPYSLDRREGPLDGAAGSDGEAGHDGVDGVAPATQPTLLGPRLLSAPAPGATDGECGGDGGEGRPGAGGRTGGAAKTAEITIRELAGELVLLAAAGGGGSGGAGGHGGPGGAGGHGAAGVRGIGGVVEAGAGGRGGRGGAGGEGGRGGNGGISSNVFISIPAKLERRVHVLLQDAPGGAGGRGGAPGAGGRGGRGGTVERAGAPGPPGAGGRDGDAGRTRPAPPVYINERPVEPAGSADDKETA
jgi:hypothetical protein